MSTTTTTALSTFIDEQSQIERSPFRSMMSNSFGAVSHSASAIKKVAMLANLEMSKAVTDSLRELAAEAPIVQSATEATINVKDV